MTDSRIRKRITIAAGGTPEYVGNAFSARLPEGVPRNAVIVEVELRTESTRSIESVTEQIQSSHLVFTLEWPA